VDSAKNYFLLVPSLKVISYGFYGTVRKASKPHEVHLSKRQFSRVKIMVVGQPQYWQEDLIGRDSHISGIM
jgi:hypothetical protein